MNDHPDLEQCLYEPIGGILVRMPLLPIECNVLRDLNGPQRRLAELAVFAASPSLYQSWIGLRTSTDPKTRLGVAKYVKRLSSRPTPYGLFAGVGWAEISEYTDICRGDQMRLALRPDSGWFCTLVERLESDRAVRGELLVKANEETLIRGGRAWVPVKRTNAVKPVNSVRATPPVLYALECTRLKSIKFAELVAAIQSKFGVKESKAIDLCHALLDESILVSSLHFPLSTSDPLEHVCKILRKAAPHHSSLAILEKVHARFNSLTSIDGLSTTSYAELLETVKPLVPDNSKDLLQADMTFDLLRGKVGENVVHQMGKSLELMIKLSPSRHDRLVPYTRAFEQRYQTGRVVPILELLDETFGLGSPYSSRYHQYDDWRSSARDQILLRKLHDFSRSAAQVVELTEGDVAELTATGSAAEVPLSADLFVQIVAVSKEAIDRSEFQLLISPRVGEIGAGKTIGRFARLLGEPALRSIRAIKAMETGLIGDDILAEISFWPDVARMMNVALTPKTGLPSIPMRCVEEDGTMQIPLSEIVIGIEYGQFFAEWLRTGQRLHVQSGSLLNSDHVPDSGRLLIDIALQHQPRLISFDWGVAASIPFLPRVVCGRTILSPARWNLNELIMLSEASELSQAFSAWRIRNHVPNRTLLSTGPSDDNQLFLDFCNDDDVAILIHHLKTSRQKHTGLILQEFISSHTWQGTSGAHFATELVASFVCRQKKLIASGKTRVPKAPVPRQTCLRPLGTNWCYLRLDCAAAFHEEIIVAFRQAIDLLIRSGKVKKWFFVRYADHVQNLRLRLEVDPDTIYSSVLPLVCEWAQGQFINERCSSYSFQTYEREVERFGGVDASEHVEEIFHSESEIISKMLAADPKTDRRLAGISFCSTLVQCFGFDRVAGRKILESGISPRDRHLASEPYRVLKTACMALVQDESRKYRGQDEDLIPFLSDRLRILITPHADAIMKLDDERNLCCSLPELVQSLIHMQSNRLFGIDPAAEAVTRGLVARTFGAIDAIEKNRRHEKDTSARLPDAAIG